MSELRNQNEEIFGQQKTEHDSLKNAEICETIADDNFMWYVEEAIYWRKKALKIREKINGKSSPENVYYYERITDLLLEKGNYKEALKWNEKTQKLIEKLNLSNLSVEVFYAEIFFKLKLYENCIIHGDAAYSIIESEGFESLKHSFELINRLICFYASYLMCDNEKRTYAKLDNCIEIGLQVAEVSYGDTSIEIAKIYREKAVYLNLSKQEKLDYLKKALIIALATNTNSKLAFQIFYDIRRCWPASERLEEGFKWVYENISEKFIVDVLPKFNKADQERIENLLDLRR